MKPLKFMAMLTAAMACIALFILMLLGPLALFWMALVFWIGCDPVFAVLCTMLVGVPWAFLLPAALID
jgi:hypothetical protein